MRIKGLLSLIAVFLLLPLASGDITAETDTNCAVPPANYTVTIDNNKGSSHEFVIKTIGTYRTWLSFEEEQIRVRSHSEGKFEIFANPPPSVEPGTYQVPIRVYGEDVSFMYADDICVFIPEIREVSFLGENLTQITYEPGEELTLVSNIENTGTEGFVDVVLSYNVKGPSEIFIPSKTFDIEMDDTVDFTQTLEIEPEMLPGDYSITMEVRKDGKLLGTKTIDIEIKEVERLEVKESTIWTPIANFKRITFDNSGNVPSYNSTSYTISRPLNALVTVKGDPVVTEERDSVTYTWDATLSPGEESKTSYRINYWPILIIVLALIYGGYKTFFSLRRPSVRKVLLNSRRLNEHMQEFTIALEIRNKTPHNIKKLEVRDFVPAIAKVVKDFGSLKPKTKVSHGTEMVWNLKDFKRDDQRMIRYRIVTTVGTVDKFRLPKAVILGSIMKRKFRVHSNELGVGSDRDK